ncbi:hypothetical protein AMEX_G3837 [Scomber scombrus]|uniref:Uncharacterized protein n=1 Tax=Scomber scombrus TaxID=13677 RepID=A0AAV1P0K9_SCOSC
MKEQDFPSYWGDPADAVRYSEEDERTNQNIKWALRKYVNENHDDWDLHIPAVVHTPYFLMFNRHPLLPEVMNACPMGDPKEGIDTIVTEMKALNDKVLSNIERAQARQQKSFGYRKRKSVRVCSINVGDDVLISDIPNRRCRKETLAGPFTVASISTKGVATVVKDNGRQQQLNVSRLRPYYRLQFCWLWICTRHN